ncbi:MAG: hypothetical protein ACTSUV_02885 [Candidatus Ranarchaeia archaeon]
MIWKFTEEIEDLKIKLEFEVSKIGEDILLILKGPNEHIGGVSLSEPYIRKENEKVSSSVSTISTRGHQDGYLTQICAKEISKKLNKTIVVLGGLHIGNLKKEKLLEIEKATYRLIQKTIPELKKIIEKNTK